MIIKFRRVLRTPSIDTIVFVIGCAVVLASAFGPLVYLWLNTPASLEYRFADGFFYDYYHYLMKIQNGIMGYMGHYNRFSEVVQPVTWGHIIFPLLGKIFSIVGIIRSDIIYLIARVSFLITLFVLWFFVVRAFISGSYNRLITHLLFFTSTGIYKVVSTPRGLESIDPVAFSGFYQALQKFPAPPQHVFAACALLAVFYVLHQTIGKKELIMLGVLAFACAMAQPVMAAIGIMSLWGMSVWTRKNIPGSAIFTIAASGPLAYYWYLFSNIEPWSIWAKTTYGYNYQIDFLGYVLANGMFVPFLILLFPLIHKLRPALVFLLFWGCIVPTVLFPFAYRGIGISLPRLLQLQQYIPLTLLSGWSLMLFFQYYGKKWSSIILVMLSLSMVAYAYIPWKTAIVQSFEWKQYNYTNIFLPKSYVQALRYLETNTKKESVVLAGEYISATIPAFSHNRVIVGRGDASSDYQEKLAGLYAFFGPDPKEEQSRAFLRRYGISYIIFGIDSPLYDFRYSAFPFLAVVFSSGDVTVAQVISTR